MMEMCVKTACVTMEEHVMAIDAFAEMVTQVRLVHLFLHALLSYP